MPDAVLPILCAVFSYTFIFCDYEVVIYLELDKF